MRTESPADLERMKVNLVGGDPIGGLCLRGRFFLFRPCARSMNGTHPVRGFTHPGPGLGGGSGILAAKRPGA
ncbi:MAG: hypothetical protein ACK40I_05860 [Tabrizicola sp.]